MSGDRKNLWEMEELDEKIIADKPWGRRLLESSLAMTRKAVLNWSSSVIKIGESELNVEEYVDIFLKQISTLYEDLVTDVDALQEKSLDRIMKLLERMQQLCRDLHIEIPSFKYEDVPLSELKRRLTGKIEEYEALVGARRAELAELHRKQSALAKRLGREPRFLQESPLPMAPEVEELRVKTEMLETEAMEREEQFFQLKEHITELVAELRFSPSLDFEKEILNLPNNEVRVTDYEMEQLRLFHARLVKKHESVCEEIADLRGRIDDLWDRFETGFAERDAFRRRNGGNSLETLANLKREIRKLEDLRKAKMQDFIAKGREELVGLWGKCRCTQRERDAFAFFNSECFTEDLLELHDREIAKYRKYYEENKAIFALLERYEESFRELKRIELNVGGGVERYKNRNCQLLKEEKLRTDLKKEISKSEQKLRKLAEVYFVQKSTEFRTFGQTIDEYIAQMHQDLDKEFKLKLSAKKQQREQATTSGRSRMNLFPGTSALHPSRNASKRKVATPMTEPSKKLKSVLEHRNAKTGFPKVTTASKIRRSLTNKQEKRRKRLSFRGSSKENAAESSSTSYDDFEKECSTKNNCRSTGYVLKEHNQLFKIPAIVVSSPRQLRD